jgi:hypothetical protein
MRIGEDGRESVQMLHNSIFSGNLRPLQPLRSRAPAVGDDTHRKV